MSTTVSITSRGHAFDTTRHRSRLRSRPPELRVGGRHWLVAVSLALLLAACGGDDDAGAANPVDAGNAATGTASLTVDQRTFETAEADGGAATLSWGIPFDGGPLKSPDHHLAATFSGGLKASPSTGPQALRSTRRNLASPLGLPSVVATQVIVGGNLSPATSVRIRYDGGRILKEYLADGGVVLWAEDIHDLTITALSGALTASPARLAESIPLVNWTNSRNLAAGAQWKAGSAFVTRESLHLGDTVYAQSCTADSSDVNTVCPGGAVLENAFPQTLIGSTGRPYEVDFLADGDISVVQGLRMWISREPRSLVASNTQRHRVYYERGGAIHAGTLIRDRTPLTTRQSNGAIVTWSTQLNQAAVDSIAAAFVVNGVKSDGATSSVVTGPTVDLLRIGGHGVNGMLNPADLRAHYGVPSGWTGAGQTIAIVAVAGTGNVAADLNAFSRAVGLPECNASNPCFEQIDLRSDTSTASDSEWGLERALDVQTIHAMAPGAKIVLVTSVSNRWNDLSVAIARAASIPGVTAVSMSFSSAESSSNVSSARVFSAYPTVAFFASAGDEGHVARFPAAAPQVTAVGGTRIKRIDWTQPDAAVAWLLSGGGTSKWQTRPAWQTNLFGATANARGFSSGRVVPDVAALADPQSGNAIFHESAWSAGGGTSAAAPLWAAISALLAEQMASGGRSLAGLMQTASPSGGGFNALLYRAAGTSPLAFHDVVAGSTT
jgi:hypothetical protein